MNKAILMGRLTKDPELRYTNANNTPVCSFTLAIDRRFKSQSEERQADFIPVVAWGKTAEFCSNYFRKGRQVAVSGRIQTRSWDDNEGKRHYTTEVVAEDVYFADSKKDSDSSDFNQGFASPRPQRSESGGDGFFPVEDDDELPF